MTKTRIKKNPRGKTATYGVAAHSSRLRTEGLVVNGVEIGSPKKTETPNRLAFDQMWRLYGGYCWEWRGEYHGAAQFRPPINVKHTVPAIKWVYENQIGSLPDSQVVLMPTEICQLTNERGRGRCVNPDHYQPMNPLDAYQADLGERARTGCANGHEYTNGSVTYSVLNKTITCRICSTTRRASGITQQPKVVQPEEEDEMTVQQALKKKPEVRQKPKPEVKKQPGTHPEWLVQPGEIRESKNVDLDRFFALFDEDIKTGCWVWHSDKMKRTTDMWSPAFAPTKDDGNIGQKEVAYRWIFEVTYGKLPRQTQLIALPTCVPDCVNPDHRIPMNRAQYGHWRKVNYPQISCLNGHVYQEGDVRVRGRRYPNGTFKLNNKGHKECLVCKDNAVARKERQLKAAKEREQKARESREMLQRSRDILEAPLVEDAEPEDNRPVMEILGRVESAADLMPMVKVRKGLVLTDEEAEDILAGESLNTVYHDETGREYTGAQILEAVEAELEQHLIDEARPSEETETEATDDENLRTWREDYERKLEYSAPNQVVPGAVVRRPEVQFTPQTGLKTVDGVIQRMTTDEISTFLHLDGLPDETISKALRDVETAGRKVAPWLYADADKVFDEPKEPEPEPVKEPEVPVSSELVYFSLNCKIPLNLTGEAVKKLMDVLVSVGATQIQL